MNIPFDRRQWLLSSAALAGSASLALPSMSAAQQAKLIINTYGGISAPRQNFSQRPP